MWRAGPDAKPRGRRQSGFTLLEILVVVGLVAMLSLAVLVVPVWVDDQRQLDSESASLADTLIMLNEQSLFSGRLMALRVTERGWTPLTAIQIEYSLAERSYEAEVLPMVDEMGLSITAWSPLKSGLLTGKYTRESAAQANPTRGEAVKRGLTERNFTIIDALVCVAEELAVPPSQVALAWLLARPGIVIPIVGASRPEQLEQNLSAASVSLSAEQLQRLDKASRPPRDFMQVVGMLAPAMMHGGMSVNGVAAAEFKDWTKPGGKNY